MLCVARSISFFRSQLSDNLDSFLSAVTIFFLFYSLRSSSYSLSFGRLFALFLLSINMCASKIAYCRCRRTLKETTKKVNPSSSLNAMCNGARDWK